VDVLSDKLYNFRLDRQILVMFSLVRSSPEYSVLCSYICVWQHVRSGPKETAANDRDGP